MVTSSSTRSSTRIFRPALVVSAALFAALLAAPRAALAAGHGGGGGHGGGSGGGSGHGSSGHGSSAHGGSGHGGGSAHVGSGGSHGGAWHGGGAWRGGSFQRASLHGGGSHGGGFRHVGGFRHFGGFRHVGFPFGWGWWGWDWSWGWAPYYSSWWWGGPGVYVAAGDGYGDDGYGYGSTGAAARTSRYAVVKTNVSPEEAQVFLDGKYIGTADDFDGSPDYLYLGTGKYHIELRLPGYQNYAIDLDVSRGQRLSLDQTLKLEPGKSALDQFPPAGRGTPLGRVFTKGGPDGVAAPAPAPRRAQRPYDGWSDRNTTGGTEGDNEAPPAPAPRHAQRPNDGWSDRDAAASEPEERVDLRAESLPRPAGNRARMRFKVTPEDAAVYVDDKYLGAGEDLAANPRGVVTDPGKHSITVTRPGYKSKTVDITVRIGAPVDVVVELEK